MKRDVSVITVLKGWLINGMQLWNSTITLIQKYMHDSKFFYARLFKPLCSSPESHENYFVWN